jgi:hypothetical protein
MLSRLKADESTPIDEIVERLATKSLPQKSPPLGSSWNRQTSEILGLGRMV